MDQTFWEQLDILRSESIVTKCIYCKGVDANSLSHIIPESLGNNTTLRRGVCDECNSTFNREVEEPIVKALAPIRSFLQLEGKRDELPLVRIEVRYGDGRQIVAAKSLSELLSRAFVFTKFTDPKGVFRNIAFVSFDQDAIEPHQKRYHARHRDVALDEIPRDSLAGLEFWAHFDFSVFSDPRCLRMVAKIAFEWWCMERSPEFVSSEEYDDVRNYIRYGAEPASPIVSVVDNDAIVAYFRSIPFGAHLLYRWAHPRLPRLVMIIAPYSLVYYQVVLARRYRALAPNSMLTAVNPQTGNSSTPIILNPRGKALIVTGAVPRDRAMPEEVVQRLSPALLERLNQGMRGIIQQSKKRPSGAEDS
jgi:HNH endonuclease